MAPNWNVTKMTSDPDLYSLKNWPFTDFQNLVLRVIELWSADYGNYTWDGKILELMTGGWSDNEDIIQALEKNQMFWRLCWEESRRGGYYKFDLSRAMPVEPGDKHEP